MSFLFLCIIVLALFMWHLATRVSNLEKRIKDLKIKDAHPDKQPESQKAFEPETNKAAAEAHVIAAKTQTPVIKTAMPEQSKPQTAPVQKSQKKAAINWEIFTGVKLFAWVGGFAAFLGIVFFTKYAIDSGFITPLMRVCAGFTAGIALVCAGLFIKNEKIKTTSNVFCAIGIVFVYVSAFAAGSFYDIFSIFVTFIIMIAASAGAFAISVHQNAKYIAVLAAIGGYLTPILISTGSGAIVSLSVYMAVLTATIMMIAVKKEWGFLVWLSAIGVYFILLALSIKGFVSLRTYDMAVIYSGFCVLFTAFAGFVLKKYKFEAKNYALAPFLFNVFSMFFVFGFFGKTQYLALALLSLINACLLFITVNGKYFKSGYTFTSGFSFLILFLWTSIHMNQRALWFALGAYFIFFLLNGFLPLLDDSRKKIRPSVWRGIFPAALLFTAAVCVAKANFVYLGVWSLIIIIALFALAYSEVTKNIFTGILSVFGIFVTILVWLVSSHASTFNEINFTAIICFFAFGVFLMAVILKKKGIKVAGLLNIEFHQMPSQPLYSLYNILFISIFFLLSVAMIKVKPELPNVFIASGLIVSFFVILMSLINESKKFTGVLTAVIAMFLMQLLWQTSYFTQSVYVYATASALYFFVFIFFFVSVFLLKKHFMRKKMPWFVAALVGVLQCFLIYLASKNNPAISQYLGVIPAIFAVIYGITALCVMRLEDEFRKTRVAIFTAAALFFVTLIFPMQFKTQWLIVGWALEAAALIALFKLISYKPLKYWGFWIFVLVFFKTVVPDAYLFEVTAGSILNWYLYLYSIVIVSMFAGASLWMPKDEKHAGINNRITLYTLATILLFVLLNTQIAAFFADDGRIRFDFNNSLAQDMSYTLCWGLFAIGMFVLGIIKKVKAVRISGLILLSAATFKLFLHDLWNLGQLYRIGSLFGLAVMLILVSFLYQKYVMKKE